MLLIVYSSATGTAADVAATLGRRARSRGVSTRVVSAGRFNPMHLIAHDGPVLFVVATTGQGAAPRSWEALWSVMLAESLPKTALARFNGSAFVVGLGDSSYARFCAPAKRLAVRLAQLGAEPRLAPALCDDQDVGGPWKVLAEWEPQFWAAIGAGPKPA